MPQYGDSDPRGDDGQAGFEETTEALDALDLDYDRFQEILSRVDWVVGAATPTGVPPRRAGTVTDLHGPEHLLDGWHHRPLPSQRRGSRLRATVWIVSWSALAIALAGFVCGGVLLGWSLVAGRAELWNIGETVTLASQVGLLIGLVLQLDSIGHDHHQTDNRLTLLNEQVGTLQATTLLGAGSPQAKSFYSHLAAGATPDILLADLKSQLDLLATQIGQRRSA